MALSRKHRREQRRLRKDAQDLLDEQRVVLSHAGHILGDATRHAKSLNNAYIAPRVDEAADQVRPYVDRGVQRARRAADNVRLFTAPLVASALASTVRTLDRLENGSEASKQLRTFGEKKGLLKPEKKKRAGGVIAIGLGVAAAATVGYALWQAFRTDDELWVAPE